MTNSPFNLVDVAGIVFITFILVVIFAALSAISGVNLITGKTVFVVGALLTGAIYFARRGMKS